LSGLLSGNLDTVGHSQVCHPIQDRTLERQFFELIVNLASLQPIAEDRLEAEDRRLRQAPAMIIDWSLIPVGRTSKAADRRKPRAMRWREARLALAH
jgi:hypothetical protein